MNSHQFQHLQQIADLIRSNRIDLTDEKRTQADIEVVFTAAGLPFEREKRLAKGEIVDFLAYGNIAVEVKIGGSRMEIFRQLRRYAEHEVVAGLVLVSNVPMTLPPKIKDKPALVTSLGAAWI